MLRRCEAAVSPSLPAIPFNASQIPSSCQLSKKKTTPSFGHFAPRAEHLPPLRFSACPTPQLVLRALRTKRERQKRMLTSFIDEDCQEARLKTKGLNLAGGEGAEEEMPEAAGACAGCRMPALAGCSARQLLSDYIFLPAWWEGWSDAFSSAHLPQTEISPSIFSPPAASSLSSGVWGCCLSLESVAIESPLNPS